MVGSPESCHRGKSLGGQREQETGLSPAISFSGVPPSGLEVYPQILFNRTHPESLEVCSLDPVVVEGPLQGLRSIPRWYSAGHPLEVCSQGPSGSAGPPSELKVYPQVLFSRTPPEGLDVCSLGHSASGGPPSGLEVYPQVLVSRVHPEGLFPGIQ